jgi:hypothetical protein
MGTPWVMAFSANWSLTRLNVYQKRSLSKLSLEAVCCSSQKPPISVKNSLL